MLASGKRKGFDAGLPRLQTGYVIPKPLLSHAMLPAPERRDREMRDGNSRSPRAVMVWCGVTIMLWCAEGLPAQTNPPQLSQASIHLRAGVRAETHFRETQKRFQSEPTNTVAAWEFARAGFDRAEFATNERHIELRDLMALAFHEATDRRVSIQQPADRPVIPNARTPPTTSRGPRSSTSE